ncbi:hypothetical protein BC830DRAFT_157777 [Chytriomyces sp. MP71]|nr:hypothetical protein BC830DRAFT_157777 [Chytriomyces sp. MP71]
MRLLPQCLLLSATAMAASGQKGEASVQTSPVSPLVPTTSATYNGGFLNYKIANIDDIRRAGSSCRAAVKITGTPTCEQFTDLTGMWTTFVALNAWIDCALPLKKGMLVCVPTWNVAVLPGYQPSAGATGTVRATGTLSATQPATSAASSSSTETSPTTTSIEAQATTTTATTTSDPPPPPPQTTQPPPPQQPPSSPGSVDVNDCLNAFARGRSTYNGGNVNPWLTWSGRLAAAAQGSADFAAGNNCCDASCHTNSGGDSGIAQVLYCGQFSCSQAYGGWVDAEASYQGGHWQIIVGYPVDYPYFGCAVSTLGSGAIVCDFSWGP